MLATCDYFHSCADLSRFSCCIHAIHSITFSVKSNESGMWLKLVTKGQLSANELWQRLQIYLNGVQHIKILQKILGEPLSVSWCCHFRFVCVLENKSIETRTPMRKVPKSFRFVKYFRKNHIERSTLLNLSKHKMWATLLNVKAITYVNGENAGKIEVMILPWILFFNLKLSCLCKCTHNIHH